MVTAQVRSGSTSKAIGRGKPGEPRRRSPVLDLVRWARAHSSDLPSQLFCLSPTQSPIGRLLQRSRRLDSREAWRRAYPVEANRARALLVGTISWTALRGKRVLASCELAAIGDDRRSDSDKRQVVTAFGNVPRRSLDPFFGQRLRVLVGDGDDLLALLVAPWPRRFRLWAFLIDGRTQDIECLHAALRTACNNHEDVVWAHIASRCLLQQTQRTAREHQHQVRSDEFHRDF